MTLKLNTHTHFFHFDFSTVVLCFVLFCLGPRHTKCLSKHYYIVHKLQPLAYSTCNRYRQRTTFTVADFLHLFCVFLRWFAFLSFPFCSFERRPIFPSHFYFVFAFGFLGWNGGWTDLQSQSKLWIVLFVYFIRTHRAGGHVLVSDLNM